MGPRVWLLCVLVLVLGLAETIWALWQAVEGCFLSCGASTFTCCLNLGLARLLRTSTFSLLIFCLYESPLFLPICATTLYAGYTCRVTIRSIAEHFLLEPLRRISFNGRSQRYSEVDGDYGPMPRLNRSSSTNSPRQHETGVDEMIVDSTLPKPNGHPSSFQSDEAASTPPLLVYDKTFGVIPKDVRDKWAPLRHRQQQNGWDRINTTASRKIPPPVRTPRGLRRVPSD